MEAIAIVPREISRRRDQMNSGERTGSASTFILWAGEPTEVCPRLMRSVESLFTVTSANDVTNRRPLLGDAGVFYPPHFDVAEFAEQPTEQWFRHEFPDQQRGVDPQCYTRP